MALVQNEQFRVPFPWFHALNVFFTDWTELRKGVVLEKERFAHNFDIFPLLVMFVLQMANACILVADDDMSSCLVLRRMVERLGLSCDVVRDGD